MVLLQEISNQTSLESRKSNLRLERKFLDYEQMQMKMKKSKSQKFKRILLSKSQKTRKFPRL